MDDETKLGHLIKGVAEDLYQILLAKDVKNVEQFLKECRKIELLKKKRIVVKKFERLKNVAPIDYEEEDISSLIRRIRDLAQPMSSPDTLEDIIREEHQYLKDLQSRQETNPGHSRCMNDLKELTYASIPSLPKSQQWRTPDDRPLCFLCGKPGHVVRYCRERRQAFTDARTRRESRRPTSLVSTKKTLEYLQLISLGIIYLILGEEDLQDADHQDRMLEGTAAHLQGEWRETRSSDLYRRYGRRRE
ncbi:hypothetical protein LAZ67_23001144 [Cordylochernes scorpioides]|uniref:CCHC-type domain-containing protein n=1 Tax=Cordylochernes scorpioides TaxID=51811 RepID=A0ABY6LVA3_9ARAC|nr:hypothetical protein LAZ67_23001144 [Cordylochernes scorpioides]